MRIHLFAACLASSTLLPAQSNPETAKPTTGFVIDAGDHDLAELIERAAKFLGRNILFDVGEPAAVQGRRAGAIAAAPPAIHLQKRLILDAIACEEVLGQLAYTRGFVIVPLDRLRGVYEVIALHGRRSNSLHGRFEHLAPDEVIRRARAYVLVSTVVKLDHLSPQSAMANLGRLLPGGLIGNVQMAATGSGSTMLLAGLAPQVAGAIRMLDMLDVPGAEQGAHVRNVGGQLRHLQQQNQQLLARIQKLENRERQLERLLGGLQLGGRKPAPDTPSPKARGQRKSGK